jgi:hypothetical protein
MAEAVKESRRFAVLDFGFWIGGFRNRRMAGRAWVLTRCGTRNRTRSGTGFEPRFGSSFGSSFGTGFGPGFGSGNGTGNGSECAGRNEGRSGCHFRPDCRCDLGRDCEVQFGGRNRFGKGPRNLCEVL